MIHELHCIGEGALEVLILILMVLFLPTGCLGGISVGFQGQFSLLEWWDNYSACTARLWQNQNKGNAYENL